MFFEDSKSKFATFNPSAEIGLGLIIIGLVFYSIGVVWFLDRGFLCIGNVSNCS